MKKTVSVLLFIMALFGVAAVVNNTLNGVDTIINLCCIIFICILQILKNIAKLNTNGIGVIQLVAIVLAMGYGFSGVEYLIPIIIFEVFESKINPFTCILISLSITSIMIQENIFNIAVYTVIVSLYLYEGRKQHIDNEELKEFNKGQRYQRHIMAKKITNLEKYLEQNNITASLKERNFMAQKLHDHLGHRITSSLMQLEVTKETIGKNNELSEKYLISAMENLREGMDEIRDVLRNVKPRDKVMGIEDIKEQLLKFQYNCGIKTTLKIEGDTEKIKFNIWIVIEENLKEALTNAAKYSEATEIKVSILIYNKIARIEVRDNGVGCTNIKSGLGLKGMEERMQAIGGRIDYTNDNGFAINMMLTLGVQGEY